MAARRERGGLLRILVLFSVAVASVRSAAFLSGFRGMTNRGAVRVSGMRGRESSEQEKRRVVDSFTFQPAWHPDVASKVNYGTASELRDQEEHEAELEKERSRYESAIQAAKREGEARLQQMRVEYEESAAAWDRKIRQMADVLEQQRSQSNMQELELYVVRTDLEGRRGELRALEATCAQLQNQVNASRALVEELEGRKREDTLRIKELEYEVMYTEDQFTQEQRIVKMRDSRIRDLEQGLVDAACVQSSMNTTIQFLQARVAELEAQVDDLQTSIAQGRAAEERLRREMMAAADRHQSEMSAMEVMCDELNDQLRATQVKLSDLEAEVRQRSEVVSAKETAIAAADRTIATLQAQISHDKDDYQALEQQLRELHGEHYQTLSTLEAAKKDKAQAVQRVDLLLAELQSERQLRLKENEVWRAAVDVSESSRLAAERTVDELDARLRAVEDTEEDRRLALQQRKADGAGRWARVIARTALALGMAGLTTAPAAHAWWGKASATAARTIQTAAGGRFAFLLPHTRLARVAAGLLLAMAAAFFNGRNGRVPLLLEQGRAPEPPKWNVSGGGGFFITPRP